jgi:hypothetical protein
MDAGLALGRVPVKGRPGAVGWLRWREGRGTMERKGSIGDWSAGRW